MMSDEELKAEMQHAREIQQTRRMMLRQGESALREVKDSYEKSPYRNGQVISRRAAKLADGIEELLKRMEE